MPAVLLWMSTIGYGCLAAWIAVAAGGVTVGSMLRCLATLILTSLPLSLALLLVLRHAAALRPVVVAACGGLAVSGITAVALAIFQELDATVMVLVWSAETAVPMVSIGCALGRWKATAPGVRAPW